MKALNANFMGQTKAWWLIFAAGLLMIVCGFAYWLWPAAGFAVGSQIFGWMLILVGIVQLCVGTGPNRTAGWGWWIVGGVIDLFIGFTLVRSIMLSEMVFPYFIAFIFIYWGISAIINACSATQNKYWWLYLINGVLMLLIGFFFIEAGWVQNMLMSSFLLAIAFIYWGFSLTMVSYDLKPKAE
ncbi:MAG: DUF308 domain-containing protein [Muribaculaceae bacterium]|nr:DUF308 domain-containing protein [Muribaculaceae bacterium]